MNKKQKIIFAFFMSLTMTLIISGVLSVINIGFTADLLSSWLKSFSIVFPIAFPSAIFVAPLAKKLTEKICK